VIQGNSDELPGAMVGSPFARNDPHTPFPATADSFVDSIMSNEDNGNIPHDVNWHEIYNVNVNFTVAEL
jgi:hypothetical protein